MPIEARTPPIPDAPDAGGHLRAVAKPLLLANDRGDKMWVHFPDPGAAESRAAMAALLGALGLCTINRRSDTNECRDREPPVACSLTPSP
jgi:hypothetical protein